MLRPLAEVKIFAIAQVQKLHKLSSAQRNWERGFALVRDVEVEVALVAPVGLERDAQNASQCCPARNNPTELGEQFRTCTEKLSAGFRKLGVEFCKLGAGFRTCRRC